MLKVRKGGGEEIPFIQDKEQQLLFAGAAVKRYCMPKNAPDATVIEYDKRTISGHDIQLKSDRYYYSSNYPSQDIEEKLEFSSMECMT
ncbi:hypothetical protein MG293_000852 [Ovis ammon polii]|uniref:Uncharacterized protein n=1 Tax=Ovis ammon polii TaxID=230172 RepID=A0AAD4UL34_OVIAM|nr:hypothetical protein MG293_000852 [Ovis ammon polii]